MENNISQQKSNHQNFRIPFVLGFIGVLFLIFESTAAEIVYSMWESSPFARQISLIWKMMGWGLLFLALARFINIYLKYGFSIEKVKASAGGANFLESVNDAIYSFERRLREIEQKTNKIAALNENERQELLSVLKNNIQSSLHEEFEEEIKESVSNKIRDKRVEYIRKQLRVSIDRLSKEVSELSRRGNLNLIIGALATLAGFLIFGMMVFDEKITSTNEEFVRDFIPRLSLIVLIEVFAYFFLGLYRSSLNEIKYFQNEVTNIELKYTALEYAVQYGDKASVNEILSSLAATERNFVLKKGESTVSTERDKLSAQNNTNLIGKLADLLRDNKSSDK